MLARQYRRSSENGDYWRLGVDLFRSRSDMTSVDTFFMIPSPSSAGSAYNDAGDHVRRAESSIYSLVCGVQGLWGVYLGQRAESTGERRYNKICFVKASFNFINALSGTGKAVAAMCVRHVDGIT